MRTIPFWVLLLLLPLHSANAQQARGLYLAVHGPDAPRSVGDPNSLQALYFDVPVSSSAPIHVRVFDAETGGNLDARRGAFNSKTRFVLLGGASANEIYGIDHNPARNRRMTFPASDVIFDETVGANNRIDGRYWNLATLPVAKGYPISGDTRRFVLLAIAVEGDDANFFDYVLSTDPDGKVPPAGVSMFTYELTLRTPESRGFIGEIHLPVAGHSGVVIETFGLDGAPMQVNIPFRDPQVLNTRSSDMWSRHPVAISAGVSRIGLQFQGMAETNTFSVVARSSDGAVLPIPLPIVDYEPVTKPRFTFRTAYADTSCGTFRFTRLGDAPAQFRMLESSWIFADGRAEGAEVKKTFDNAGWHPFTLRIRGVMGSDTTVVEIRDSVRVNMPPTAWAGGDRTAAPGRSMAFDGTVSEDPDGYITRYEWDFGDGNTGVGARIDYQYARAGVYTVTLRVRDDSDSPCSTAMATAQVRIAAAPRTNRLPIAEAGNDKHVSPDRPANYVGDRSRDPDGRIVSYEWIFPGDVRVSGARVSQGISEPGWHTVYLEVTDNDGGVGVDSLRVRVNHPPVPVVTGDLESTSNTVRLSGAQSTDADPDGRIIRYDWTLGDGKTLTGADITHTYAGPGTYQASLMVTDNSGTFSSRQTRRFQVVISEEPNEEPVVETVIEPVVVPQPVAPRANRAPEALALLTNEAFTDTDVLFDGSRSSDPDGDTLRYSWFVDGELVGTTPILNHVFRTAGRKTVMLRVDDGLGRSNSISEWSRTLYVYTK